MATHTFGTNANNSLVALKYGAGNADADIATIAEQIYDDFLQLNPITGAQPGVQRIWPGAFTRQGMLIIPNRGYLKPMPGDVIAIDVATGFPILVSAAAAASGPYTFT